VPAASPHIPPLTDSPAHHAFISALRAVPLPRGRYRALRTYQRLARLTGRVKRVQTYFGATMECDLADYIPQYLYHFRVWEPHISAAIQALLRPGETFCDIGANIGYYSLLASSLVGPHGRVVAIEPSRVTITRLQRNLSLNSPSNVRVVPAAVSSNRGTVSIYRRSNVNTGMDTTIPTQGADKVCEAECFMLSEILTDEERSHLGIIKIDIEGGEPPILRQLIEQLDAYPRHFHILVEMADAPENIELFTSILRAGFKAFAISNSYDLVRGYLDLRSINVPVPIDTPPVSQQDVLFTRA
jgi:FkbM family methyltransferase